MAELSQVSWRDISASNSEKTKRQREQLRAAPSFFVLLFVDANEALDLLHGIGRGKAKTSF